MVPDSRSTSSRMCELNRIVRPCSPSPCSRSIMCSRCRGSMPLNGSSSSSTSGSCTSDAGHPDPLPHALGVGGDPPVLRVGHLHDRDRPPRGRVRSRAACAAAPLAGRTPRRSGTRTPSRARAPARACGRFRGCASSASPPTVSSPRDGARNPAIRCSSVDLPAPFGPSSPVTPGPIVIVMSLTATTLPYQRETLRSSIAVTTHPPSGTGRQGRQGSPPSRSRT